jgi:predicted Fe-S protein YdhL (DUF1289 family)
MSREGDRSDAPVASPCTQVCTLNAAQVCVGCGRRIEEIVEWPQAAEARRRTIVVAARERLQRLQGAGAE